MFPRVVRLLSDRSRGLVGIESAQPQMNTEGPNTRSFRSSYSTCHDEFRAESAKRAEKTREEAAAENRPGDAGRRPASGGHKIPKTSSALTLPLFVFGILWPSCSREARVAGTVLSSLLGGLCVLAYHP